MGGRTAERAAKPRGSRAAKRHGGPQAPWNRPGASSFPPAGEKETGEKTGEKLRSKASRTERTEAPTRKTPSARTEAAQTRKQTAQRAEHASKKTGRGRTPPTPPPRERPGPEAPEGASRGEPATDARNRGRARGKEGRPKRSPHRSEGETAGLRRQRVAGGGRGATAPEPGGAPERKSRGEASGPKAAGAPRRSGRAQGEGPRRGSTRVTQKGRGAKRRPGQARTPLLRRRVAPGARRRGGARERPRGPHAADASLASIHRTPEAARLAPPSALPKERRVCTLAFDDLRKYAALCVVCLLARSPARGSSANEAVCGLARRANTAPENVELCWRPGLGKRACNRAAAMQPGREAASVGARSA